MSTEPARQWAAALLLLCSAQAFPASLESLVMPGPVAGVHADTEDACSACHDLFQQRAQSDLCIDCHEPVGEDMLAGTGFHGREAREVACSECHSEHRGRQADILGLQPSLFNHDRTDFPLTGAHAAQTCGGCHEPGTRHADAPTTCQGCHEEDDAHDGGLGSACQDCHQTDAWRAARFDHDTTHFPLLGNHAQTACLACHDNHLFQSPGNACIDCHRFDDAHNGANGPDCGSCHDATDWDASFDHERETGFALTDAHALLSCGNCHVSEGGYESLPTDCNGCHAGDDVHLGRNGSQCGGCHNQSRWQTTYDHEAATGYALLGAHGELACGSCHTRGLETALPVDCVGCHDNDDPHQGTLNICEDCHSQDSWQQDLAFHHDLTAFPLLGMHRVASCEQCHDSLAFTPLNGECRFCHAGDDAHGGAMGTDCAACHNPTGWSLWSFDHHSQTGFGLGGAHSTLTCADCHPPGREAAGRSRACVTCHRSDDVHDGRFGRNCDRCHTSMSFRELKDDL